MTAVLKISTLALALFMAPIASASALTWTALTPLSGWSAYGNDTRPPAVAVDSNKIVHFRGALSGAQGEAGPNPFSLPADFHPRKVVYVPGTLYQAVPGCLVIFPDGTVEVKAASGNDADYLHLTSIEGVTFSK